MTGTNMRRKGISVRDPIVDLGAALWTGAALWAPGRMRPPGKMIIFVG